MIADALMYGDGKAIVRFEDMSMRLSGLTQSRLESIWGASSTPAPTPQYLQTPAIYDKQSIMEFSNGRPSLAFGPEYEVFDSQRRIARLPGPPYQFMDRVTEVNPPKFVHKAGDWIEAHYDVPPDEWYFAANRQDSMSYAILLEAALQPCGWLAAYCGSALRSDSDMKFRNLGGTATLYKELFPEIGTIRMRVRMTDVSEAGGMIIENFDMEVYSGQEMIYKGTTYFGFFSAAALAKSSGSPRRRETDLCPHRQGVESGSKCAACGPSSAQSRGPSGGAPAYGRHAGQGSTHDGPSGHFLTPERCSGIGLHSGQ